MNLCSVFSIRRILLVPRYNALVRVANGLQALRFRVRRDHSKDLFDHQIFATQFLQLEAPRLVNAVLVRQPRGEEAVPWGGERDVCVRCGSEDEHTA